MDTLPCPMAELQGLSNGFFIDGEMPQILLYQRELSKRNGQSAMPRKSQKKRLQPSNQGAGLLS
jgi:hypothetical protein